MKIETEKYKYLQSKDSYTFSTILLSCSRRAHIYKRNNSFCFTVYIVTIICIKSGFIQLIYLTTFFFCLVWYVGMYCIFFSQLQCTVYLFKMLSNKITRNCYLIYLLKKYTNVSIYWKKENIMIWCWWMNECLHLSVNRLIQLFCEYWTKLILIILFDCIILQRT